MSTGTTTAYSPFTRDVHPAPVTAVGACCDDRAQRRCAGKGIRFCNGLAEVRGRESQVREDVGVEIELVVGDITTMQTDVVVTAANRSLAGGGGVDAAVHRAAGPELLRALRPLAPCPVGGAVITPAFLLDPPIRHVVHAVGPRYGVDDPADALLASAYRTSLERCDEVSATSVAFPSLSTGAYHFPLFEACQISVDTLLQTPTNVERCVLVAFDVKTERFWRRALAGRATQ